ncbi:MAG: DUF6266 family protein [Balneolales bacterium]
MAKYKKGILGGFYGTVGNVIGSTWKGIEYMKSKPAHVFNPKTIGQQTQRQKFGLIISFLKQVKMVIKIGFSRGSARTTEMNRAASYNLKNAITGNYPDQEIDYPSLLLSRGDLTGGENAVVSAVNPDEVHFEWDDNSGVGSATAEDQAMVIAYDPESGHVAFQTNATERQFGEYDLLLDSGFQGQTVECYLAFVSPDGNEASNSDYLGSVVVA